MESALADSAVQEELATLGASNITSPKSRPSSSKPTRSGLEPPTPTKARPSLTPSETARPLTLVWSFRVISASAEVMPKLPETWMKPNRSISSAPVSCIMSPSLPFRLRASWLCGPVATASSV